MKVPIKLKSKTNGFYFAAYDWQTPRIDLSFDLEAMVRMRRTQFIYGTSDNQAQLILIPKSRQVMADFKQFPGRLQDDKEYGMVVSYSSPEYHQSLGYAEFKDGELHSLSEDLASTNMFREENIERMLSLLEYTIPEFKVDVTGDHPIPEVTGLLYLMLHNIEHQKPDSGNIKEAMKGAVEKKLFDRTYLHIVSGFEGTECMQKS